MKRCPKCRRDYLDDSLVYCLDDGARLLEGPALDGPPTAIMRDAGVDDSPLEQPTKQLPARSAGSRKLVVATGLVLMVALIGGGAYMFFNAAQTPGIDS